jgi:opacity protein-like surface antigen
MRHLLFAVAASLILAAATASAQEPPVDQLPQAELFVGYSHLGADFYGLGSERLNAPGWKGGASIPVNSRLSIDMEGAGNYLKTGVQLRNPSPGGAGESADVLVSDYTVFIGPRVNFGPVFLRAMFGGDCLYYKTAEGWDMESVHDSEWSVAGAFGGGVKIPVSRLVSFQASVDYEVARHNIFGATPAVSGDGANIHYRMSMQNNLRFSAGVVFNIFKRHDPESKRRW